jgi:hypothetical protein
VNYQKPGLVLDFFRTSKTCDQTTEKRYSWKIGFSWRKHHTAKFPLPFLSDLSVNDLLQLWYGSRIRFSLLHSPLPNYVKKDEKNFLLEFRITYTFLSFFSSKKVIDSPLMSLDQVSELFKQFDFSQVLFTVLQIGTFTDLSFLFDTKHLPLTDKWWLVLVTLSK